MGMFEIELVLPVNIGFRKFGVVADGIGNRFVNIGGGMILQPDNGRADNGDPMGLQFLGQPVRIGPFHFSNSGRTAGVGARSAGETGSNGKPSQRRRLPRRRNQERGINFILNPQARDGYPEA